MEIVSSPTALQNKLPPQTRQKPRSAVSEDLYQLKVSEQVSDRLTVGTLVMATWCPLVFRHCVQWQAITPRSAPRMRYRTPPHRQPPVCVVSFSGTSLLLQVKEIYSAAPRCRCSAIGPSAASNGRFFLDGRGPLRGRGNSYRPARISTKHQPLELLTR